MGLPLVAGRTMETVMAEEQDRRFDGGVFIHYGTDNSSINVLVLPAFPGATIIQVIAWCLVILAGHSWVNRIYLRRGKAVMKHYAKRSFRPIVGITLYIIPLAVIIAWMLCLTP